MQANHRCVQVEEAAGWVRIDTLSDAAISTNPFAHWEMMQPKVETSTSTSMPEGQAPERKSFYARLVVAADGINSTIRQILYENQGLKEWAKPQYSGFAGMGSKLDTVPTSITEELKTKYTQGDRITTIHNDADNPDSPNSKLCRLLLMQLPDQSVIYFCIAPSNLRSWQNKSLTEILDLRIEVLKNAGFPAIFTDLLGLANPKKLSHRPFYLHPVQTQNNFQLPWSLGRVVLVGDAAHGMPPFMAQGANQGFEDAAVIATSIAKLIQNNGLDREQTMVSDRPMSFGQASPTAIANTFEQYEQIRRSFVGQVQTATMTSSQWTQQQWEDFNEILHRRIYPSPATLGVLG